MSEIRVKSTGKIKLFESDNTSHVTIASPSSLSANRTITIPDADVDLTNIAVNTAKTGITSSQSSAITANTAKTSNATHSGEVTGATALTIADNIVDEANLKVSNSPVNGYMLTSQSGASGGMTWAEAPSGGLVKTGQVNLGTAGNLVIDNCFTADYDNYLVVMEGVRCTADSQSLRLRFRTGGASGSTDTTSQYRYASYYADDDGSKSSNTGVDQAQFQISDDSEEAGDWKGYCGTFTFYQPRKATSSRYSGHGSFIRNDKTDIVASYNAGHFDNNVSHTGLDFFYSSGGVASGSVVIVYGFKE